MSKNKEISYIVCQPGGRLFLHFDPINHMTWGGRSGAFEFRNQGDAIRVGSALTPKGVSTKVIALDASEE